MLDVHFSPHFPWLLAAALSDGSIGLYRIQDPVKNGLTHMSTSALFSPSTAVLSLAWHPRHHDLLAVSLSTGTIAILQLSLGPNADDPLTILAGKESALHNHVFSVWTVALSDPGSYIERSYNGDFALWSGGDDGKLRYSTVVGRHGVHDFANIIEFPALSNLHGSGITTILPLPILAHPTRDNLLLTGGYDGCLRVVDTTLRGQVLAELFLGGGVWNLKFARDYSEFGQYPRRGTMRFLVLASCLEAGAQVVEVRKDLQEGWHLKVLAKFEEHKDLVYRTGVLPARPHEYDFGIQIQYTCVSVSFYTNRLCVWTFVDEDAKPVTKEIVKRQGLRE